MAALTSGDFDTFSDAVARESAVIDKQQAIIDRTEADSSLKRKPTE